MLYSKNGSYPYPFTDGSEGWIEVEDKPEAPEGKEVVWWYPPGWVVRDPEPASVDGFVWKWSQSEEQWVSYPLVSDAVVVQPEVESIVLTPMPSGNVSL